MLSLTGLCLEVRCKCKERGVVALQCCVDETHETAQELRERVVGVHGVRLAVQDDAFFPATTMGPSHHDHII
jgi:hypothetical protein